MLLPPPSPSSSSDPQGSIPGPRYRRVAALGSSFSTEASDRPPLASWGVSHLSWGPQASGPQARPSSMVLGAAAFPSPVPWAGTDPGKGGPGAGRYLASRWPWENTVHKFSGSLLWEVFWELKSLSPPEHASQPSARGAEQWASHCFTPPACPGAYQPQMLSQTCPRDTLLGRSTHSDPSQAKGDKGVAQVGAPVPVRKWRVVSPSASKILV